MDEKLVCPFCGWWLMSKSKKVKTVVKLITDSFANVDFSIKCKRCKKEIGITKS